MNQISLSLRRIKAGKVETFRTWLDTLQNDRHQEAVDTLAAEHVLQETWFIASIADQPYAAVFMRSEGQPLPGDEKIAINKEHRAILAECLEQGPWIKADFGCNLQQGVADAHPERA